MKIVPWTLALISMTATVAACSVGKTSYDDDSSSGDDSAGSGGESGDSSATTTSSVASSTNSASSSASSSATGGNSDCTQQPDFQSCAQCYAEQNPAGADVYVSAIIDELYCGTTCGSDGVCSAFCEAISSDPNAEPTTECNACVNGIAEGTPDLDAFLSICQASSSCVSYAQSLVNCPD